MKDHAAEIFGPLLRSFGGAAYATVQAMKDEATIKVPRIEVTVHPGHLDQRDVYFDRTGKLDDTMMARAYELLAERHADELDAIATQLAQGELA